MKKLLSILAAVGLTATASASVISCGTSVSKESNENQKPKQDERKELKEIFDGVDQLNIKGAFDQEKPDKAQIISAIEELGKDIELSQLDLDLNEDASIVTIIAKENSTLYKGQIEIKINYTKGEKPTHDERKELKEIFDGVDQLNIKGAFDQEEPVTSQIAYAIQELNKGIEVSQLNLALNENQEKTEFSTTIIAKENSTLYKGQIEIKINYTKTEKPVDKKLELKNILQPFYANGVEVSNYDEEINKLLAEIMKNLNVDGLSNDVKFYLNDKLVDKDTIMETGKLKVEATSESQKYKGEYVINLNDTLFRITKAEVSADGQKITFAFKNGTYENLDWNKFYLNVDGVVADFQVANDTMVISNPDEYVFLESKVTIRYFDKNIKVENNSSVKKPEFGGDTWEARKFINEVKSLKIKVLKYEIDNKDGLLDLENYVYEQSLKIISEHNLNGELITYKESSVNAISSDVNNAGLGSYIFKVRFYKPGTQRKFYFDRYLTVNAVVKGSKQSKYFGEGSLLSNTWTENAVLSNFAGANDVLMNYYNSLKDVINPEEQKLFMWDGGTNQPSQGLSIEKKEFSTRLEATENDQPQNVDLLTKLFIIKFSIIDKEDGLIKQEQILAFESYN